MNEVDDSLGCGYDADRRLAKACESGAPWLTFDGDNAVGSFGSFAWSFVHGPGLDDPLLGVLRSGTSKWLYYYVTDGEGREFAVADSTGGRSAAGVESAVSGTSFMDAWTRNFGIGASFLGASGLLAWGGVGGGFAEAGANSMFQGFVAFRDETFGLCCGFTFGNSAGFARSPMAAHSLNPTITYFQHEFGHTIQFIGLSALGDWVNLWIPYVGLGAPGLKWHNNPWEKLASWLGS